MRRPASIRVSLFPFLAVLLCAMGALIVLLVILTHEVRNDALQRRTVGSSAPAPTAEEPAAGDRPPPPTAVPREPVAAPQDPDVELRAKQARLRQRREDLAARLARRESTIASRKAKRADMLDKLREARMGRDADASRLRAREAELDEARETISALAEAAAAASAQLEQNRRALATAPAKIQIVPYDGRSGTARKPILIECTAKAIRFVPSGVALTPQEIEGFPPEYNPLLAGAAALRNYWSVHADSPAERHPYVLLLVHDEGIIAYYVARSLLKSLGSETGYVLVTDEMEIARPDVDPAAQEACREAVQESLAMGSSLDALTSEETEFRHGRFQVDPREHDPTIADQNNEGLYPIGPPASAPRPGTTDQQRTSSRPAAEPSKPSGISPAAPSPESPDRGRARPEGGLPAPPRGHRHSPKAAQSQSGAGSPQTIVPRPATSNERHWGQSAPRAVISLEHEVAMFVSSEVIQVGNQPALLVGPGGLNTVIIEDVLRAIELEAQSWGDPPESFFWSPHVKVAVVPGSEFLFTQLRAALEQAGLQVSDHIALEGQTPRETAREKSDAAPQP